MSTPTPESIIREFWRLMGTNDFHAVRPLLAEDFALEWPQSRERIRGAERFARVNAEYLTTGRWSFRIDRLVASGDTVVTVVAVADEAVSAVAVSCFTVAGGRIARIVEYWPEPFPPAGNRRHLVEPMD
jgi:ketosteroid isomerase-like protein